MHKALWIGVAGVAMGLAACSDTKLGPEEAEVEGYVLDGPEAFSPTFAGTAAGDFRISVSSDGDTCRVGVVSFPQEMKVDLAAGSVFQLDFEVPDVGVDAGERLEIRFDLNVEDWLTASDVQAGAVTATAAEIRSATSVSATVR